MNIFSRKKEADVCEYGSFEQPAVPFLILTFGTTSVPRTRIAVWAQFE
jgi:hypothetical protein